jgi:molybdenum cofactor cytidylyltransferase
MIYAVLPAAGKSTRMGRPKLLLPLGGRPVLECVITALRQAGVDQVLVVVGPHVRELAGVATQVGAHVCLLAEETPDMRATVERGLRWLEEQFQPRPEDAWLLCPADHPTLEPLVVRQLLEAQAGHPSCTIFIPSFGGRRGHPALIGWRHVAAMRELPAGVGLNVYLRQQAPVTQEVTVAAEEILLDLDTPEDYTRLQERHGSDRPGETPA